MLVSNTAGEDRGLNQFSDTGFDSESKVFLFLIFLDLLLILAFRIEPSPSLCVSLHCLMLILSLAPVISQAQNVPSSNAFLFSLRPFNTNDEPRKLEVLLEKRNQAIRRYQHAGPCWGKDKDELCFNNQQVDTELNSSGVYDVNGISNPTAYFTGESSFHADDVEVFTIGGKNVH